MDNTERFRNEFSLQLANMLTPEQYREVMHAFDKTSCDYEFDRKKNELILVEGIPQVVKDYIGAKSVSNLSMNTLMQYSRKLIRFFDTVKKPFMEVKSCDIHLYLANFKQQHKVSDSYLDTIRRTLNTFFEWLVSNEYILHNPCAKVEPIKHEEKRREPLSAYELEEVRYCCQNIREKAIIDFFFSTGLRVSECCDVSIDDINWHDRSVIVRHGKGNKQRMVFFNAESELTLRKYLETRTDDNKALFVAMRKPYNRLGPRAMEVIINKISKRVGIHTYPHRLRHTFATAGLHGGMPLSTLQALMGHEKPETTLIYAKHDTLDLQREHSRVYS